MARILYGVAGEGFGHSSRSELLGRRLLAAGHEVLFAASQKSFRYLGRNFEGRVKEVYGLHFICEKGKVRRVKTFFSNAGRYFTGFRTNWHLFRGCVREFQPELVISDFEPFSQWWAWRHRVPCVSIDHEHLLTLGKLDRIECSRRDRFFARLVTRGYHTWTKAYVILNFFKVPLRGGQGVLTPPVVRPVVRSIEASSGEHIVVYSTDSGDAQRKQLSEVFKRFSKQRFFVYGFEEYGQQGNLLFKKTSTEGFLRDLASSRAVVATAGFSLISECLHFRKRMLLMPVRSQFEQIVNAHYIQKIKMGMYTFQLTHEDVDCFLHSVQESVSENPLILWPDNEKYFEILGHTFNKIGLDISL